MVTKTCSTKRVKEVDFNQYIKLKYESICGSFPNQSMYFCAATEETIGHSLDVHLRRFAVQQVVKNSRRVSIIVQNIPTCIQVCTYMLGYTGESFCKIKPREL